MGVSLVPFVLTIVGGIVYHLSQKAAGSAGNPWLVLVAAYGAAFVTAAVLWWLFPAGTRAPARGELVAAALIGLAALAIEAGFFFAYRSGWAIGTTALVSSAAVTVVLSIIGVVVLGESVTAGRAGGALLAMFGGWLIVRG